MPYEVSWKIPDKVLYVRAFGAVGSEDVEQITQKMFDIINQSPHDRVHLISDSQDISDYPTNLNAIINAVKPLRQNSQIDLIVTVGNNGIANFFSTVATKVTLNKNSKSAISVEAAIDAIKSYDASCVVPSEEL